MTTIVVTHEDNQVDQFTFDANDRVISIGRRSSNDVCIPNLSVSGMHARITIDGNSASIEDNSSTNGTYVNGRLISRQLINDQDEIVIGQSTLVVKLDKVSQSNSNVAQALEEKTEQHASEQPNQVSVAKTAQASMQDEPPVLKAGSNNRDIDSDFNFDAVAEDKNLDNDFDFDNSFDSDDLPNTPDFGNDQFDDRPMSLSEKAKLALGRQGNREAHREPTQARSSMNGVAAGAAAVAATSASAAASRAFARDSDVAVAEAPTIATPAVEKNSTQGEAHPLDDLDNSLEVESSAQPATAAAEADVNDDAHISKPAGAVIEIQNGAKSGQVLPIDKPVTTLGRPGIQIAAIMRKPDGYFLMHIESDDSVDKPTLNRDAIGDDPVMLQSGDRLNVAGIDVEFMLS